MIELCFLAYILFDPGKKFLSCDPAWTDKFSYIVVSFHQTFHRGDWSLPGYPWACQDSISYDLITELHPLAHCVVIYPSVHVQMQRQPHDIGCEFPLKCCMGVERDGWCEFCRIPPRSLPNGVPPSFGMTGGWGPGQMATWGVPPPDRHFGRWHEFSLRRECVPENGGYPHLEVPWRGYPVRTNARTVGVPHPSKSPGQALPSPKDRWGVGYRNQNGTNKKCAIRRESGIGKWDIPPPWGTLEGVPRPDQCRDVGGTPSLQAWTRIFLGIIHLNYSKI